MLNKWRTDKHHEKLKGEEDKAESEKFLTVNFQRKFTERCVKWLTPYENNADKGKRIFLSGFAVYKQMLAEGKNKAKQTTPQ